MSAAHALPRGGVGDSDALRAGHGLGHAAGHGAGHGFGHAEQ